MGATKSFREQREAVFHPRDFAFQTVSDLSAL